MKSIIIFFLLELSLSYNPAGAVSYAKKYCNNYNINYNNYKNLIIRGGEDANFVSQCMNVGGGQDFEGCEARDNKGMFRSVSALKNCLISKGWKQTARCQKGNPIFMKSYSHSMIIIDSDVNNIFFNSHYPDRCSSALNLRNLNSVECYEL